MLICTIRINDLSEDKSPRLKMATATKGCHGKSRDPVCFLGSLACEKEMRDIRLITFPAVGKSSHLQVMAQRNRYMEGQGERRPPYDSCEDQSPS
jgi:hypothetical protein